MQIATIRQSKNLTQQQLADGLNVNRTTVAMWESGKSSPRADLIPEIASVLGCTISELFGTSDTESIS